MAQGWNPGGYAAAAVAQQRAGARLPAVQRQEDRGLGGDLFRLTRHALGEDVGSRLKSPATIARVVNAGGMGEARVPPRHLPGN